MFTIVKHPQVQYLPRDASEPRPEIINHRNDPDSKRWSEKLRNEEITYKHLKLHRDELLESEIRYKKTIKQLEKEKEELVKVYEPTYDENKVLKSLLEHGPDAVKMKKLRKAEKELGEEVDALKNENKRLAEEMQDLIKKHAPARDELLEKNWKNVLAESKKTIEKNEEKVTQGPFPGKDNEKSKSVSQKRSMREEDEYDLQLDTVEKEIQILLNNVRHIKKQKENLDYASLMRKGAIVRNSVLGNAINEKLDEELTKFKTELDTAKSKHDNIKEQFEQKAISHAEIKKDAVDNSDRKTSSEKTMIIDQCKTYTTRETQTEEPPETKISESDGFSKKVKRKRMRKSNANVAVQTDFPNIINLKTINQEKYIEQYENKKSQIIEANLNMTGKVSSTRMRKNYAKKLVVRLEENPSQDEKSNNVPKHISRILLDKIDETPRRGERPLNVQKEKDKPFVAREVENTERVEKSTIKQQRTFRSDAKNIDELPNRVEKSVNNLKRGKYKQISDKDVAYEAETVPKKSNKDESNTKRKSSDERLPKLKNTNMSDARRDFPKSKVKSKSVEHLNKLQDVSDYENMIMNPRTDIMNIKTNNINSKGNMARMPKSRFERKPNDGFRQSRVKSKSSAEIRLVPTHSKPSAKKHRIPVNLPLDDKSSVVSSPISSWKSESDLPIFPESDTDSVKPSKDFRLTVKRKNNYVHLRGVLDDDESDEKRDESAYDKVLHDLNNQQKESAREVYQDFNKTVHKFREYKSSSREKQKLKNTRYGIQPNILPQAPLTFSERASYQDINIH